jgi:Meiotically up-regulated gene 113
MRNPPEIPEDADEDDYEEFPRWVYFIRAEGGHGIKIGVALDPRIRRSGMQTNIPYDLTLLGVLKGGEKRERELHERFAEHRLRGEWYADAILPEVIEILWAEGHFATDSAAA